MTVWVPFAVGDLMANYQQSNPKPAAMGVEEYDFDGIAYFDLYPDISLSKDDQLSGWDHYRTIGKQEGRYGPRRFPTEASLSIASGTIDAYISRLDSRNVPLSDRTIVLYYVPSHPEVEALEALANSIKIFSTSIFLDPAHSSTNLYIFNVREGAESVFYKYIPTHLENVAVLVWQGRIEGPLLEMRSLDLLHGSRVSSKFGSLLFTSILARGPLAAEAQGQWVGQFRQLLAKNHVGIVGATLSCDGIPHIQDQAWALHQSTVPQALGALQVKYHKWKTISKFYSQYLSVLIGKTYNISSIQYHHALGEEYFTGKCLKTSDEDLDPRTACDVNFNVLFLPWNSRYRHKMCVNTQQRMQSFLLEYQSKYVDAKIYVPDTMVGGITHDVALQFSSELLRGAMANRHANNYPNNINRRGVASSNDQACLLVRSSLVLSEDYKLSSPLDRDYFLGYHHFIQCTGCPIAVSHCAPCQLTIGVMIALLRQTDGNWVAYFFIADHHKFGHRLKQLLSSYQDPRLQFLPIPKMYRLVVSPYLNITQLLVMLTMSRVVLKRGRGIHGHGLCAALCTAIHALQQAVFY